MLLIKHHFLCLVPLPTTPTVSALHPYSDPKQGQTLANSPEPPRIAAILLVN